MTVGNMPEITWTVVEAAARYEPQVTDLATSETIIQSPSVAGHVSYARLSEIGGLDSGVGGIDDLIQDRATPATQRHSEMSNFNGISTPVLSAQRRPRRSSSQSAIRLTASLVDNILAEPR
jgi:hypothetical protein